MLSKAYITRLLDGRVRVLPRTEIFCGLEEKIFPASRIRVPRSAIFYGLGQKKTQKKIFCSLRSRKSNHKKFFAPYACEKTNLKKFFARFARENNPEPGCQTLWGTPEPNFQTGWSTTPNRRSGRVREIHFLGLTG